MPIFVCRYNIPYLMDKSGTGNKIMGEIYEVDGDMLEKLDELEDHPRFNNNDQYSVLN